MERTRIAPALLPSLLLLAAGGLTTACEPPALATACSSSEECPEGYLCDEERSYCYLDSEPGDDGGLEADSGRIDGGAVDRVALDHAGSDSSAPDTRRLDTSTPIDSAELDAGAGPDRALADAASADLAPPADGGGEDQLVFEDGGSTDVPVASDAVSLEAAAVDDASPPVDSSLADGSATDGALVDGLQLDVALADAYSPEVAALEDASLDAASFEGGAGEGGTVDGGSPRLCRGVWWDPAWPFRRSVTFEIPTEELAGFSGTVPVVIAFGNSAGTDSSAMTQPGLRVVDSSNEQVAHEVELWEEAGRQQRIIWTELSLAERPFELCLYYTEDGSDPDTSSVVAPPAVWAPFGYTGVWHFAHHFDNTEPFPSSLQDDWDLEPRQEAADGQIGSAARIAPNSTAITGETSAQTAAELTISFWLRVGSGTSGHLVRMDEPDGTAWDFSFTEMAVSEASLEFTATYFDGSTEVISSAIHRNQWVHVALVRRASFMELYVGGAVKSADACVNVSTPGKCDLPVRGALTIGAAGAADELGFDLDELRISDRAALSKRIQADHIVTSDPFGITSLGPKETQP